VVVVDPAWVASRPKDDMCKKGGVFEDNAHFRLPQVEKERYIETVYL
jgi:hypothetical protein